MLVGIIQSNFIPWRGYFDFIRNVDLFVVYDDVQYTDRDWRNRNYMKVRNQGPQWVTVPVINRRRAQLICETQINYSGKWLNKLTNLLQHNYGKAPYYKDYIGPFSEILEKKMNTISELNVHLIKWFMEIFGIQTEIRMSGELCPVGSKTERLVDILKKTGADNYLSGPSAKQYLDQQLFRDSGIGLSYKSYKYSEYPQLHGEYCPNLSALDLLFNCGPESKKYLDSELENEIVLL